MIFQNQKTDAILELELRKMLRIHIPSTSQTDFETFHYRPDGSIVFSNGHGAVRVGGYRGPIDCALPLGAPFLDPLFEGAKAYPRKKVVTQLKRAKDQAQLFRKYGGSSLVIELSRGVVSFESYSEPKEDRPQLRSAKYVTDHEAEETFTFCVDPRYLENLLLFFIKLGFKTVTLRYDSPLKPLLFEADNVNYLIAPKRLPGNGKRA